MTEDSRLLFYSQCVLNPDKQPFYAKVASQWYSLSLKKFIALDLFEDDPSALTITKLEKIL